MPGQEPEPDAAEVQINVAAKGDVIIKGPEQPIQSEPSDDTPEVEIIIKVKGSVAVNMDVASPDEVNDYSRVGKVRHDGEMEGDLTQETLGIEHG